jgi:biotin operon repressor
LLDATAADGYEQYVGDEKGYARIPNAVIHTKHIKKAEKLVLIVILSMAHLGEKLYVSQVELSLSLRMERETISKAIEWLTIHGFVEILKRVSNGPYVLRLTEGLRSLIAGAHGQKRSAA